MSDQLTDSHLDWAAQFCCVPAAKLKAGTANASAAAPQITIFPESITLDPAGHVDFTATADDSDGTSRDVTAEVDWSSSEPDVAIDKTGRATAKPVSVTATIRAIDPTTGASGTATIVVAPPMPVAPRAPVIFAIAVQATVLETGGGNQDGSGAVQLVATATYSDGHTADVGAAVVWSSDNPAVTVDASRMAQAKSAPAKATITATDPDTGVHGSVDIVVPQAEPDALIASIAIAPADAAIDGGGHLSLTATATYANGDTRDVTATVQWASSNVAVSVDAKGVASATPVTATVTITATDPASGVSGETMLTVAPPKGAHVLTSLAVTPQNGSIPANGELQFTATGSFDDGKSQNITAGVNWSSSVAAIAIDAKGKATTGVASATATITATDPLSGKTATAEVSVAAPQERRVQTKFGEISYWSFAEAAVEPLIAAASAAYDTVEPMSDKLDKAFEQLAAVNGKIGTFAEVKKDIDGYTTWRGRVDASQAMDAELLAKSLKQDVDKLETDFEDLVKQTAIDEDEVKSIQDADEAAAYRALAQELDVQNHVIITMITNTAKGLIKKDPTVMIDEAADLLETYMKETNEWRQKASAMQAKADALHLKASTDNLNLALTKQATLSKYIETRKNTAEAAKSHYSGKWAFAEKDFDDNPDNHGVFRFKNVSEGMWRAKLVVGYADPVLDAAKIAHAAAEKLSQHAGSSPYWMVDAKQDKNAIDTMADVTQQMAEQAKVKFDAATTWLAEYEKILDYAHAAMEHAPAQGG